MKKFALLIALSLGAFGAWAQEDSTTPHRNNPPGPPPGERQVESEQDRPNRPEAERPGYDRPGRRPEGPAQMRRGPRGPVGPRERMEHSNQDRRGFGGGPPHSRLAPAQEQARPGAGPDICPQCRRPYGPPPAARLGGAGPGFGPEGRGPGFGRQFRHQEGAPMPPRGEFGPRRGLDQDPDRSMDRPGRGPRADRPGPGPRDDRPAPSRRVPAEPDAR